MRRLLLVPVLILALTGSALAASGGPSSTAFNGRLDGFSTATITARDGGRGLTCLLTTASPSITSFQVGEHVQLVCRDHVLVGITLAPTSVTPAPIPPTTPTTGNSKSSHEPTPAPPATTTGAPATGTTTTGTSDPGRTTAPPTPSTASATFGGTITALTGSSITLQDGSRTLTCSIGPSSPNPATYGLGVGSRLSIACANGVLTHISSVPMTTAAPTPPTTPAPSTTSSPPSSPTTTSTSISRGTITSLSTTSIAVTGDRLSTCSIGSNSPSPLNYGLNVGSKVSITCVNGTLVKISAST